jgi:hypothetical protein
MRVAAWSRAAGEYPARGFAWAVPVRSSMVFAGDDREPDDGGVRVHGGQAEIDMPLEVSSAPP